MSIEIRNLSITSKIIQRQSGDRDGGAARDERADAEPAGDAPPGDWRLEIRRMIQELLELQRER